MIPTFMFVIAASAAELAATYDPVLGHDMVPELRFELLNYPAAVVVECVVGGETLTWEFQELAPGATHKVPLPKDPDITSASCQVLARFASGQTEGVDVEMSWRFVVMDQLGEASRVSMDLNAQVATLPAPFEVHRATVQALKGSDEVLFEEVVELRPRAGRTTVRWSRAGADKATMMRFVLEGEHGEKVAYDVKVERN